MKRPDRSSPIPLYHQIALDLRRQIEDGSLPPGSSLDPMREAAERLGVNLHTVRHAYAELVRQGLVESRRAAGTKVLARARATNRQIDPVEKAVLAACHELNLEPRELRDWIDEWLRRQNAESPLLHVVECSLVQAEDLASQLQANFSVDARPWPLEQSGQPTGGIIVATFFHYNELRLRWPETLHDIRFLTIRPDPELAHRLQAKRPTSSRRMTVCLCEIDEPTWEAVAADLSQILPAERFRVRMEITAQPGERLRTKDKAPVLFTPRAWSCLSPEERAHPRATLVRYVFDRSELAELGRNLQLPLRHTRSA